MLLTWILSCIQVWVLIVNASLPRVLTIDSLLEGYRSGRFLPGGLVRALLARIAAADDPAVWISVASHADLRERLADMDASLLADPVAALARRPLLGVPFAVKDNIDVAGFRTTAACREFAYLAERSADAVRRLEEAGAIALGKTNLDQFATGLVGTRSPYGAVCNPFHPDYISGGSSSGSAAATALGHVAFALGTDTAGSGRVPAGFCNLVGLKPTPGLIGTGGVVPACRSLDCVSIFAHTVADAWQVLAVTADGAVPAHGLKPCGIAVGVPIGLQGELDAQARKAFEAALAAVQGLPGVSLVDVDLEPFHAVAALLYDGPWVAERRAALGDFLDTPHASLDPIVASIIGRADTQSAADAFRGRYRLEALAPACHQVFEQVDVLLVPTTPTHYTRREIDQQPIERNAWLGRYTNFVNLLGLSALALPGPFRSDGLPAGVTLIGPSGADHLLAETGRRWESVLHRRLGLTEAAPPRKEQPLPALPLREATVQVAVVGAHLSGLPLNWQLLERAARLVETTRTAPLYRLHALPGTVPPKPGLERVSGEGYAIEVEVWEMPLRLFGSFVAEIPPPLGIGTLILADGRQVKGFICEGAALAGAQDISASGGWRAHQRAAAPLSDPTLS
ncbi:MAG: allophanate hydrolase [Proteobacteria bacterium]|nr:allophanate hydrolase [Pseudomonadota bacterium]